MSVTLVERRPDPSEPRPWHFPKFERHAVAGGEVIACHLPGQPLAVISLVLDAGAVTEPLGQDGVALLVARSLAEGTKSKDAYNFAVAGERAGATWQSDIDWDSLRCGFEVPVGELPAAAELLAEAVHEPALSDDTLDRLRQERLDEIRLDLSQPGPRARAAFIAALFEADSRYVRSDGGDVNTVATISNEDIRAFHAARIGSASGTLIIAGDLSDVDVDQVGRTVFAGSSGESPAAPEPVVRVRTGSRRVVLVDRPGSVQSMLYVGHDAPKRRTPDYVPMTTMALALGGMFNSRLNYRLREEKGYTYGAFGGYDCRRHGGVFVARAAVQSEVTAPALTDLVAELERMHDSGLNEEELSRARDYRAGIFPVNFAGPGAVAAGLAELVVHGHPDDHFDRLRAEIQSVTVAAVNEAAKTRLRPESAIAVVVGDAASIGDAVRDAGLGPVEVVADSS